MTAILESDQDTEYWMQAGLCAGKNDDTWFPPRMATRGEAQALCQGCPVIHDCLTYALERREPEGVWGGLNPNDRFALIATGDIT